MGAKLGCITECVTLGKSLSLSKPLYSHLYNEGNVGAPSGLLWGDSDIVRWHPIVTFCFIPMTLHRKLNFMKITSFPLSLPFLSSSFSFCQFPFSWHQNGKAVVREDGTIQLISFVFLHLQVNQASHTCLFIYRVSPQNQSLFEENRFSF